ncbi:MAG TPA: addiction module protein [Bacteroidia bacterium]|nr:addiction module protein [Bacteroidia bacterium]
MAPIFNDILKLSIPERILLVEAIWDSIANDSSQEYKLNPEQVKILEEELAAYSKNPDEGSSWEEVKKRITGK